MFRISAVLLALAIMCLSAFAESGNLISQDMIKADTVNYNSEVVEAGVLERTVSSGAEEYYPHYEILSAEVSGARFGEYLVSRGDEVKKGDVLATFTLDVDEAAIASMELELQRAEENMEKTIADAQESALELQRSLLNATDAGEREMIQLKIQRAEIALEQHVFEQERVITGLEERIAEALAEQEGSVMVAPEDGVILEMEFKHPGDSVREGENLILMYRTDGVLMRVDNAGGEFRYGMDVVVEIGNNKNRTQLPGRVVGADTLIPTVERSGYAYIEFELPEGEKLMRPNVKGTIMKLDNVLTVSRGAVEMDGGKYFVTKLVDGVPQKRFVNAVVSVGLKRVWVLQGLDAGDEIIID